MVPRQWSPNALVGSGSIFHIETNSVNCLLAFWRRTAADTPEQVVIPTQAVVLYYNCYYMPAICQNYANWLNSARARGRVLAQMGTANSNIFGFDVKTSATDARGNAQCPSSWSTTHTCPERDSAGNSIQPNVMPGPWTKTEREIIDPLNINEIRAEYTTDPTTGEQVLSRRSGRYYTCEEWPPRRLVNLTIFFFMS